MSDVHAAGIMQLVPELVQGKIRNTYVHVLLASCNTTPLLCPVRFMDTCLVDRALNRCRFQNCFNFLSRLDDLLSFNKNYQNLGTLLVEGSRASIVGAGGLRLESSSQQKFSGNKFYSFKIPDNCLARG